MKTRAQVTVFIIVGLVLLGIVGILFTLVDSLKTDKLISDKPQDDRARFDAAVKIIRDCIVTSTQYSLLTVAQQGGAFYPEQGGLDNSADSILVLNLGLGGQAQTFVAKGIIRSNSEVGFISPNELDISTQKQYAPGVSRPVPLDPIQNQDIKSLGGSVVLPVLCDRLGPNGPNNILAKTCENYSYFGWQTIQSKLANAIQNRTIQCADKSAVLLSELGSDISNYFGKKPQVVFGDSDVTVDYSFDTNISSEKSNFSLHETSITVPVRFKELYQFVYAVLDRDSKDILFNKRTNYADVNTCLYPNSHSCWFSGFSIQVTPNVFYNPSLNRVYDLVSATDENSVIGGLPLTFQTIVENRRPVLVPVYDFASLQITTPHSIIDSEWNKKYDLYVKSGNPVNFNMVAYDYDEETNLQYTYSGWKVTNNSKFRIADGCTDSDPSQGCNYWNTNYQDSVAPLPTNVWGHSPSASYITTDEDLGPHVVKISVTDQRGLSDYVLAAVLVGTD